MTFLFDYEIINLMKKVIINILLGISLLTIIVIICVAGVFLNEINSAPQLLVHIIPTNGTLPYYVVQHDLIDSWKSYCTVIIIVASIATTFPIFFLIRVNIFALSNEARAHRKELHRVKRIQQLESELEELKKDE